MSGPGKKLSPQEKQPLTRNDQICFVPPANGVEPLVYEAASGGVAVCLALATLLT